MHNILSDPIFALAAAALLTHLPQLTSAAAVTKRAVPDPENVTTVNNNVNVTDQPPRGYDCNQGPKGSGENPKVEDCLNALLNLPPTGIPAHFVRTKGTDDPFLPQRAVGEKCVVLMDFVNAETNTEWMSWTTIRQTALELIFLCYGKGTNRVRGTVVFGPSHGVRVTVGKRLGDDQTAGDLTTEGGEPGVGGPLGADLRATNVTSFAVFQA